MTEPGPDHGHTKRDEPFLAKARRLRGAERLFREERPGPRFVARSDLDAQRQGGLADPDARRVHHTHELDLEPLAPQHRDERVPFAAVDGGVNGDSHA
jgi:hypothetical protein